MKLDNDKHTYITISNMVNKCIFVVKIQLFIIND